MVVSESLVDWAGATRAAAIRKKEKGKRKKEPRCRLLCVIPHSAFCIPQLLEDDDDDENDSINFMLLCRNKGEAADLETER